MPPPHFASRALQIHNRYLVTETDDGLEVIDQHALHERILYEQLREKVLPGQLESQRLLGARAGRPGRQRSGGAASSTATCSRSWGSRSNLLAARRSWSQPIRRCWPTSARARCSRGLVEQLLAGGKRPESRDLLDELLHMIACKAAIKSGDRLTPEEVDALLAQRHLAQDHHHCPHGRPTALVFTREGTGPAIQADLNSAGDSDHNGGFIAEAAGDSGR